MGRGIALVQWTPAGGIGTVAISLDQNGMATISSAMADQGAGTYTILSEIVSEELKIPLSQIKTQQLDTQRGVKDTGVGGSRATRVYGNAGYEAALKAADAVKRAAAEQLARHTAAHPRRRATVRVRSLTSSATATTGMARRRSSPEAMSVEGVRPDGGAVSSATMTSGRQVLRGSPVTCVTTSKPSAASW